MKTMKSIFMMAAAIAAVSCSQEIMPEGVNGNTDNTVNVELQQMTFSATSGDEVKAVLDNRNIQWQSGDAISIFDGSGNRMFTTTDEGASATFEGLAAVTDVYYALYPYQENAVFTASGTVNGSDFENYISMTIPTEQTATAGSFDPDAFLSISKVDEEGNLRFNNLLGLVQFKLADATNVASVTLSGNDSEQLSGEIYAYYNAEGTQKNTYGASRSKVVTLKGEFVADTDYYFAVRPCAFEQGLTISVEYKDGETVTRKYLSSTKAPSEELTAGSMMKLGTITNLKEGTPNDLYIAYQHGFDLTYGGQVINKASFGEATLIMDGGLINKAGVSFIDSEAIMYGPVKNGGPRVVIIGRYAGRRSVVKYSTVCYLNGSTADDDLFVMANVEYQLAGSAVGYQFHNEIGDNFETLILDNCYFELPAGKKFIQTNGSKEIEHISILNSEFKIEGGSEPWLVYTGAGDPLDLILRNNMFWNSSETGATGFQLLYTKGKNVGTLVIDHNTIVKLDSGSNGYVCANAATVKISDATVTNNLFYLPDLSSGYRNIIKTAEVTGNPLYNDNAAFVPLDANAGIQFSPLPEGQTQAANNRKGINPFDPTAGGTYDLENGVFVPISNYSKYGATR